MILVTQAGLKPQVTPSRDIVYAWSCNPGPNAGIWSLLRRELLKDTNAMEAGKAAFS